MSGFEIFGAAAGSLVLAQQIVGSLRWGKEEYDTWKRAGHEMKELLTYAEYTSIHLGQVKARLENTAAQRALDGVSTWKNAAKDTLELAAACSYRFKLNCHQRLKYTQTGLDLKNSAQSEKTRNFSTRITRLNTLLKVMRDPPPL